MKRFLIIPLLFIAQFAFAQTTNRPRIDDQNSKESVIAQVQLTDQYTIVSMTFRTTFQSQSGGGGLGGILFPKQGGTTTHTQTISIDPQSFLGDRKTGKKYRFIRAEGIPIKPDVINVESGRTYNFVIYYQRLDAGVETFDLIEGQNQSNEDNLTYWNFNGIHISNPATYQPKPPVPVITQPQMPQESNITVRGQILDARTKQPVAAKIAYQFLKNGKLVEGGSFNTQKNTGEYRFDLEPYAYVRVVTAPGYEISSEEKDLSKVNGTFVENIYLISSSIAPPPTIDVTNIVVRGQILDARTKQPVSAKIAFKNSSNNEIGSFQTTKNSTEYKVNLQPTYYNRVITATGYETSLENIDYSSLTGSQQIVQTIYLFPISVAAPKAVEPTNIIVHGQIFDAKTRQPINNAKISFQLATSGNKEIGSSQITTNSPEYRLELQPNYYNIVATATGYQPNIQSSDWSRITGTQDFTQNIYLNLIPEAPKPIIIDATPIKVEENKFRLDKVYFEVSEATLLSSSYEQLDGLFKMMKDSPSMTIQVEGHTDNVGDKDLNQRLSLDRSFAVRQYLVDKGIAGARIKFKGYGQTKPISSNDTEEGKAKNRRVEFIILTK